MGKRNKFVTAGKHLVTTTNSFILIFKKITVENFAAETFFS